MTTVGIPTTPRVGEVVEANSASFVAQCYRLYTAPPLGQLVRAGSPPIFGVVCRIATEPLDPSRPVLARGEDAETEEEVYQENPQIARLLTSRFDALIVGHQTDQGHQQHLPPLPPRVHSFVHACDDHEIVQFATCLDFLRLLVTAAGPAMNEEVIGACFSWIITAHPNREEFRVRVGKALATELAGDLPRLNAILRRISA